MFYPEEFRFLVDDIILPAVILTVFLLLYIACESPDPTGGLGLAIPPQEAEK